MRFFTTGLLALLLILVRFRRRWNNLSATVVTIRPNVMATMKFAGFGIHRERWPPQGMMRTAHIPART